MNDMTHKIDEKDMMEKDVRTMSYDDLMTTIRFLDHEREALAANVNYMDTRSNKKFEKQEKVSRAA